MKKFFTLLVYIFTLGMYAQFDVASGTKTDKTITVEKTDYVVMTTKGNSPYIICTSPKSGKEYPVWVGDATDKTHEGLPVRKSKSGKFFLLVKSKTGNPYPKYLKEKV